jgi:hypothetical protein
MIIKLIKPSNENTAPATNNVFSNLEYSFIAFIGFNMIIFLVLTGYTTGAKTIKKNPIKKLINDGIK